MKSSGLKVGVVGATGVAGSEIVRILEEREFPVAELRPFASERSRGRAISFRRHNLPCRVVEESEIDGLDLVLMEAPASVARQWVPVAVRRGAVVVDNSPAFRYDDDTPLVVAEVNAGELHRHRGIVASPNCTTLALVPVLKPLDAAAGLVRVVAVSYQAVSGTGAAAVAELDEQLANPQAVPRVYARRIAHNVIPQADDYVEHGLTKEEHKLIVESRKILGRPDLAVSPFCVRVPVYVGHSLAVMCETERELSPEEAEDALASAPGVTLWKGTDYPTPLEIAGTDGTHVGRVRRDPGHPRALALWISCDNLRKGAGLNNVQIAEELVRRDLLRVAR